METEKTIAEHIFEILSKQGRGRIFFAREFYDMFPDSSVRFALSEMSHEGKVARLARGVFCFPKLSEHGMRMILPDVDTVASAIAENTRVRIAPDGDRAAYLLGLTGISISSSTYLTDGAPRKILLANGRKIEFRHTSEMRIFAFRSRKMQLLSNALRAIGRENLRVEDNDLIKWHLDSVPAKDFLEDVKLCPAWVRDILYDMKNS